MQRASKQVNVLVRATPLQLFRLMYLPSAVYFTNMNLQTHSSGAARPIWWFVAVSSWAEMNKKRYCMRKAGKRKWLTLLLKDFEKDTYSSQWEDAIKISAYSVTLYVKI